jgi:hypothetical protein
MKNKACSGNNEKMYVDIIHFNISITDRNYSLY